MRFEYTYRNTVKDYWEYFFFHIYLQWTGLINVIFIISIIALTISRWQTSGPFGRSVMIFGLSIFLVIQPIALLIRSFKQVELIGDVDTRLVLDEDGMMISVKGHNQFIPWTKYRNTLKRPTYLFLIPDEAHGYILPDRITGQDKMKLYEFLKGKKDHE